SIQLYREA
ncbi:Gamma-glutamyl ligase family protein, partial [Chlamydia psittaci 06-1683]